MRLTRNTLIIFLGDMLLFLGGEIAISVPGFWVLIPVMIGWILLISVEERANDYLEMKDR